MTGKKKKIRGIFLGGWAGERSGSPGLLFFFSFIGDNAGVKNGGGIIRICLYQSVEISKSNFGLSG